MRAAAHPGPWSVEDVLALPEDGQRHELVDGVLLVSPAPGSAHQRAVLRLWLALTSAAPTHLEVLATVNLRVGRRRMLIPDVVVTTSPGADVTVYPAAQVCLVAEVVSPSSEVFDRGLTPQLYAEAGVPHYLRVELDVPGAPVVVAGELAGRAFAERARAKAGEVLTLDMPFPYELDPAALHGPRR